MSFNQSLQQKLLQKLSPQQIQLMKLLQVPTANLEERIKEELEENPALEQSEDGFDENFGEEMKDEFADKEEFEESTSSDEEVYENIDISDYVSEGDDDVADYKLRDENYGDQEEKATMPYKVETSFYEILEAQLGMLNLQEKEPPHECCAPVLVAQVSRQHIIDRRRSRFPDPRGAEPCQVR